MTPEQAQALRAPFPASQIGKLPKGGVLLDYCGHGAVRSRLLEVDPEWSWEPMAVDDDGLPRFVYDSDGYPVRLWIRLTVGGVSRLGVGSVPAKCQDPEKQLLGDALRNAAMSFGVALDLWIKGHAEDDESQAADGDRTTTRQRKPERDPNMVYADSGDGVMLVADIRDVLTVDNREEYTKVWNDGHYRWPLTRVQYRFLRTMVDELVAGQPEPLFAGEPF